MAVPVPQCFADWFPQSDSDAWGRPSIDGNPVGISQLLSVVGCWSLLVYDRSVISGSFLMLMERLRRKNSSMTPHCTCGWSDGTPLRRSPVQPAGFGDLAPHFVHCRHGWSSRGPQGASSSGPSPTGWLEFSVVKYSIDMIRCSLFTHLIEIHLTT